METGELGYVIKGFTTHYTPRRSHTVYEWQDDLDTPAFSTPCRQHIHTLPARTGNYSQPTARALRHP